MARKVTAGHEALRASEHNTSVPEPTHEIVAVDADGTVLYETESCWSEKEARKSVVTYPTGDDAPERVDHFEIQEV